MVVDFKIKNKIAWISLDRPKLHNPINIEVLKKLAEYLKLCEDNKIRAVILRGNGKSFCSGADLIEFKNFVERDFEQYSKIFHNDVIKRIRNLDKAVIVEAKGYVFGAGLSLLLAADYAVASSNTVFSSGFARIGLSPNTGSSFFFPRTVGFKRAFELMASARYFNAEEALNLGIVNEVVEESELESRVNEVANFYAELPRKVVHYIKILLNVSLSNSLDEHLILEERFIFDTAKSEEFLKMLEEIIRKIKD